MRPSFPQFAALLTLFLAGAVAGPLLQAAGSLHSWEVRVHFRLPYGGEETLRVDDFHFVYYERRFIWKSAVCTGNTVSPSSKPRFRSSGPL